MTESDYYFKRQRLLNYFISNGCTGDSKEFAAKIGVGERNIFYVLARWAEELPANVTFGFDYDFKNYNYDPPGSYDILKIWTPGKKAEFPKF